ncbi:MAG: hypothetical protein PHH24_03600 [Candidatus Moranbacteria bacterium]|jgi:hydrogenase maturation factor HypF (carbamoyltransferase family)|nr:hypothetical protein [Candidatus Moranbacteria bacterium]MDD5652007.1 hypothetical protein [Candidatus Moranbacteria bacterium]MDX9855868.1 hypothetical protein [Candidatus Moranbacteria bacterium]
MKKVSNKGKNHAILALGAESAGNFSVFSKGQFFHSEDFGDLLDMKNFKHFQKAVLGFLKKEKIKPDIIITDLHPLYTTSVWGKELAEKFKAEHIQVQHHIAHTFSQIPIIKSELNSDSELSSDFIPNVIDFYGIALDGTGYGTDGKIWGGEVIKVQSAKCKVQNLERIGHLENQVLIGGDLAIKEPARVLIGILDKIYTGMSLRAPSEAISTEAAAPHSLLAETQKRKEFIYGYIKKYYSKNQFELLWNQLQQNFNCQETSSTGRILDAVSVLLGFSKNERKEKHEATFLLEKNSTKPYSNLKPKIVRISNSSLILPFQKGEGSKSPPLEKGDLRGFEKYILKTTPLFEYLIRNLHKDKNRLAATAQLYIAKGLHEIIKRHETSDKEQGAIKKYRTKNRELRVASCELRVILSGGISENKIIQEYFKSKNLLINKKPATPYGDAGLSVGQINYFTSTTREEF